MNSKSAILRISFFVVVFFSTLLSISAVSTQDVISGIALVSSDKYMEGEEFSIDISIKIKEGWYTYDVIESINDEGIGPQATEIFAPDSAKYEIIGDVSTSKVSRKYDTGFNMEVGYFKKTATFSVTARALSEINLRNNEKVGIYIQVCDSSSCLPGEELFFSLQTQTEEISTTIIEEDTTDQAIEEIDTTNSSKEETRQEVTDKINDSDIEKENSEVQSDAESEIAQAREEGAWSFFFLAMSFGGLALLTPCVFPMIPITVSFFTKRAESENSNPVLDAVLFALGIIATFVAIGLVTAAIFGAGAVGNIAANPWINIAIAAVFLIFAFNLFGAFEIQIPTSILNKLNTKANSGGRGGIMLMGLVFSLTSFTCTVPFVGSSLVATADGEWFFPVVGMLGFSLVFAIPFFLLALFPTLLKKMPKSGGWMNNLKVVMGFVEIAAALKFVSNVDLVLGWELLSRQTFVAIWIAIAILIVLYVLGLFLLKLDSPVERVGALRATFAIIFLSIAVALVPGLWNEPLGELDAFLPPRDYMNEGKVSYFGGSGASNTHADLSIWHKTLDDALKQAKSLNKNIFIDFTGWTCTNCRLMESNMFPKPMVKSRMDKLVKAKLYTDRRKEPEKTNKSIMQEKFGSIALPLYVLMTPQGKIIDKIEFTRDEKAFTDFLDKAL